VDINPAIRSRGAFPLAQKFMDLNIVGDCESLAMIKDKKVPNPIDRHVGSRVRMRRVMLGMSQEKLGESLGLTFQQVQKYEKGTNRIGASRLQQISRTLDVPPAFFFEGAPMLDSVPRAEGAQIGVAEKPTSSYISDFLSTSEGLHLNMAFARIQDVRVRKRIIDLVVALAEGEQPAGAVTHEASTCDVASFGRFPDSERG
jgi:transcriptional regulator with XRE-family HTH domain